MRATRRIYLDNIRWITVCIVVIYHVIYMFNGVQTFGVIGPFRERQWQDAFQYLVYPWFMALLFAVSGMAARYYLEGHDTKAFVRDKTRKLLVPSTIGLFVFQWILGYYNMKIGGGWDLGDIRDWCAMVYPGTVDFFDAVASGKESRERPALEAWGENASVGSDSADYWSVWSRTDPEYADCYGLSVWNLRILLLCRVFSVFT